MRLFRDFCHRLGACALERGSHTLTLYTPSFHPHTVHPHPSPSHCTPPHPYTVHPLTLTVHTHCTHHSHSPTRHILNASPHISLCTQAPIYPRTHVASTPPAFTLPHPPTPTPTPPPSTLGKNRGPQAGLNTALQTEGNHLHHKVTMATDDHIYSVAQLSNLETYQTPIEGKNHCIISCAESAVLILVHKSCFS